MRGLLGVLSHSERAHRCCPNGGFVWELKILGPSPAQHLGPFFQRMAGRTGTVAPAALGRQEIYKDERVGVRLTERNIPTGERMESGILSFALRGAHLPTALLLASPASSGSSLWRSEHAAIARGTSSAVPGQQVPDQELRREPSFSLSLRPQVPNRNPATVSRGCRKEVGTILFRRRSPGGTRTGSDASEFRFCRSPAASVRVGQVPLVGPGDPEQPGSERVGKRVRGIGDGSPRLSSELSLFRSSPT